MKLAAVSHGVAAVGDDRRWGSVLRRLAGDDWAGVYSAAGCETTGGQLARSLGIPLVVTREVDFDGVIADHPGAQVLVLCGAPEIRQWVSVVLDVPALAVPLPDPMSLTVIRASRAGVRTLLSLNDTLHLSDPPRPVYLAEPARPDELIPVHEGTPWQ